MLVRPRVLEIWVKDMFEAFFAFKRRVTSSLLKEVMPGLEDATGMGSAVHTTNTDGFEISIMRRLSSSLVLFLVRSSAKPTSRVMTQDVPSAYQKCRHRDAQLCTHKHAATYAREAQCVPIRLLDGFLPGILWTAMAVSLLCTSTYKLSS